MQSMMTLVRLFSLVVVLGLGVVLAPASATFAAAGSGTALEEPTRNQTTDLEGKFDTITEKIRGVARPAAGVALTLIALSFVFAPAFKEWAMENRKTMSTVIGGIILVGIAPEIIDLLFSE